MQPGQEGAEEAAKTEPTAAEPAATDVGGVGEAAESLDSSTPTESSEPGDLDTPEKPDDKKPSDVLKRKKGIKEKLAHLNIYLLLFILVLLIAGMALIIGIQRSKKEATPTAIDSQTLDSEAINQLQGNDIKIGDVKQTLNVESNAVFAGRILVQGGTDIAGSLKVGGTLTATSLTAAGTSSFEKIQGNELAIAGNAGVQGQFTVQKTLNVNGSGTFGGSISAPQITVDTLQLSKDLQINGHIDAGGGTPGGSNGSALGSGGTASNSGTDTAGTVSISTGSAPAGGCFLSMTFAKRFNTTPHVVITPATSDAAILDYYVSRTSTGFSVCATNPAASKNYVFDYIVID